MGRHTWRGLLAVSTLALLTGCGWFGGGSAPVGKARPGADRQIAPTGTLPSANPAGTAEQGVTPVDETRTTVGTVVPGQGGQRSQKQAREQREAPAAAPATPEPAPATPKP